MLYVTAKVGIMANQRPERRPSVPDIIDTREPTELPPGFEPRPNDVRCGRGRGNWQTEGNLQWRNLWLASLPQYVTARTNQDRHEIVSSVVRECRLRGVFFVAWSGMVIGLSVH